MPTGYTAMIGDDASFEDFVMSCARAFGACVTMRDDPQEKPIPEFQPSIYSKERLLEDNANLAKLKKMSPKQATEEAEKEYAETIHATQVDIEKNLLLKTKYLTMLTKVRAWIPPTPAHVGLKEFMMKQITDTIDFDCDVTYYKKELQTKMLSGEEWMARELAEAYHDIEYHTTEQAKEEERVKVRNKWVQALRDSL